MLCFSTEKMALSLKGCMTGTLIVFLVLICLAWVAIYFTLQVLAFLFHDTVITALAASSIAIGAFSGTLAQLHLSKTAVVFVLTDFACIIAYMVLGCQKQDSFLFQSLSISFLVLTFFICFFVCLLSYVAQKSPDSSGKTNSPDSSEMFAVMSRDIHNIHNTLNYNKLNTFS